MRFRPCIDIHNGKVKQIVGGSLKDEGNMADENFVSMQDAAFYAELYKKEGFRGGHIILLNARDSEYYEATKKQAMGALQAYPGGLQVGGGITDENAEEFLTAGASHVIVTSYVFCDGKIQMDRLKKLRNAVGKEHLVLDLSCRKKDGKYYIVTDRWQRFTEQMITEDLLEQLAGYCDEFLVHAVDVEALIRWELEPYGLISPGIFMEWLEEDPCIFDLGNWILRTALKDIGRIRDKIPHFFVNVNISAAQLSRKEFRDSVMTILTETGARPEELCLELTERCRDLDVTFLKNEVNFFHSKGIKIALDDFGTGNSSLSLALELPVDELKVDMSFIKDIEQKPQNQAVVQSIVDYANRTNTETCIEGIENQEVSDYIHQFGATWYQGYFYSKPVPIDQFETLLDVPH